MRSCVIDIKQLEAKRASYSTYPSKFDLIEYIGVGRTSLLALFGPVNHNGLKTLAIKPRQT